LEKQIAFSTNGVGKTRYPHIEDWTRFQSLTLY
jgi:hypothetical protein